jgi:uncharacterized protein YcfL
VALKQAVLALLLAACGLTVVVEHTDTQRVVMQTPVSHSDHVRSEQMRREEAARQSP